MQFVDFFLGTSWIIAIGIVWFCTDWFIHYSQLFGVFESFRLKYTAFINKETNKYFPEFLYNVSLQVDNRYLKFLLKLLSCPFCLMLWLSIVAGTILCSPGLIAPMYVVSMLVLLHVKSKL